MGSSSSPVVSRDGMVTGDDGTVSSSVAILLKYLSIGSVFSVAIVLNVYVSRSFF